MKQTGNGSRRSSDDMIRRRSLIGWRRKVARCCDGIETRSTRRPGTVQRTPARDNSGDVSGPDRTQSSGSVEQPPSNSPSRTVRSDEPTLHRSERAGVRPKYLQDFVSSMQAVVVNSRFNKIAISNNKFQMASGQGSHWLIESPTIFSSMCSPPLSDICQFYF